MAGPIRIAILADAKQAQAAFLKVSGSADSMAAKVSRVGSRMTRGLTLPIVAIGAASVKMSTDFNASMTRIQTQAGASAKDVQALSKQVLDLATKTQQGPEELAASLFHLKSIGLDNAKAMRALKESADLAAVGGANLEDTTNALGGAWRSGIKGARDFHDTVATLNAIVGAGNQTMQDLTAAMGTGFLPSARSFGISLQSVGAALALMTDEGIPAEVAATRLRMSFSLLGAPSHKAAEQLASIGLASDSLAKKMRQSGPNGGLVGAIGLLKDHLEGLNKVQQATLISNAFGGGRSSSAILTLLNNYDVLVKKQKQVADTAGKVGKAIATQAKTPQAQFKLLISTIEVLAIKIGDQLLPAAIKAANAVNKFFTAVSKLPTPIKETAAGSILFLATLGPLLSIAGRLIRVYVGLTTALRFLGLMERTTAAQTAAMSVTQREAAVAADAQVTAQNRLRVAMTGLKFGAAVAGMAALTAGARTSNDTLKSFATVGGAALLGFSVGGPIGAAIGTGAGALGVLAQSIRSASDAAKSARPDFSGLGDTLDSLTGSVTASTRAYIQDQLARSGTLRALAAYGVSTRTAISAVLGEGKARGVVTAALKSQTAAIAEQKRQIALLTAANVADQKAGTLTPQENAERKRQVDSYKAQIAAEQKVISTIRDGIGATRQEIRQKRLDIQATQELSGKLHGIPKKIASKIKLDGVFPTTKGVAEVAKKYHLLPKQIRTLISATGVDTSVKAVQRAKKSLIDLGQTKPNLTHFNEAVRQSGAIADSDAKRAAKAIQGSLEKGPSSAKANLAAFQASIRNGAEAARGIASTGGHSVGEALSTGVQEGFSGTGAKLAAQAASAVNQAIAAARKAADAHSPSRKMHRLGLDLGAGLSQGLLASLRHGFDPVGQFLDKLEAGVKKATDKLKAALQARNQFVAGFQGFATSVFSADLSTTATDFLGNETTTPPTAGAILAFQKQQAVQAAQIKRSVAQLVRKGLSPALLKQLQASGPEGFAQIQALAGASPDLIRQLNAAQRATSRDLRQAGTTAGADLFAQQIKQDRRDAADTKRLLAEIRDLLRAEHRGGHVVGEVKLQGNDLLVLLKKVQRTTGAKL